MNFCVCRWQRIYNFCWFTIVNHCYYKKIACNLTLFKHKLIAGVFFYKAVEDNTTQTLGENRKSDRDSCFEMTGSMCTQSGHQKHEVQVRWVVTDMIHVTNSKATRLLVNCISLQSFWLCCTLQTVSCCFLLLTGTEKLSNKAISTGKTSGSQTASFLSRTGFRCLKV